MPSSSGRPLTAGRLNSRTGVRATATEPRRTTARRRPDQGAAPQLLPVGRGDHTGGEHDRVVRAVDSTTRARGAHRAGTGRRREAHLSSIGQSGQGRRLAKSASASAAVRRRRPCRRAKGPTAAATAVDGTASSLVPAAYQASGDGEPATARAEADDTAGADPFAHSAGRVARRARLERTLDHGENLGLRRAGEDELLTGARVDPSRPGGEAGQPLAGQVAKAGRAQRVEPARHVPVEAALPQPLRRTGASGGPSQPKRRRRWATSSAATTATSSTRAGPTRPPQSGDEPADPVHVHPVGDVERR